MYICMYVCMYVKDGKVSKLVFLMNEHECSIIIYQRDTSQATSIRVF